MRFLSSSILLIILLLVGSSCEQTPTSFSEMEDDVINPITNINQSGKSITPEFDHPTFAVNSITSVQKAPTTLLSHLLSITKSQEHINHIGVAITLDTQKTENSVYDFNEMVLSFPPGIVAKAEGETRFYVYNLSNKEGTTIRRFEAIVPDVPEVEALMNRWLRSGSGNNKQDKSTTESVYSDPLMMNSSSCYEYLEGEQCTAYYPEFEMWGLCEIDICTSGGDDGGGSWPDDGGGFNDPCNDPTYDCSISGGGSSGGGGTGDDCSGTLLPAGCEEPLPCTGDPVLNPEIAPTENQGIEGGRYGAGRNNGRTHNGLDIKANLNTPLYSMFQGVVYSTIENHVDLGNFIIIASNYTGQTIYIMHAHLNEILINNGSIVNALDQIGKTGNTGNAAGENIVPHVHIEVRTSVSGQNWNNWNTHNPEGYLSTKFDSSGNPIPPNNC